MTAMVGADTEALQRLAQTLEEVARSLASIERSVTGQLQVAPWAGPEADHFRADWQASHRGALEAAAAAIQSLAGRLSEQAQQQLITSAADTPPGATWLGNRDLADPSPKRSHFLWLSWGGPDDTAEFGNVPLFAPGDEIEPGHVLQGALGDCYFAAALASLASTGAGRRRLRSMIRDNGDGTFTVTFADGGQVVVDDDFYVGDEGSPEYMRLGARPEALWPLVLEEAYAQRHGGFEDIDGGYSSDVFSEFGAQGQMFDLADVEGSRLESLLADGPVTFAGPIGPDEPLHSNSSGRHAFSVVGVIPFWGETQVVLRNPWGNAGVSIDGFLTRSDGTVTIPLSKARELFDTVELGTW